MNKKLYKDLMATGILLGIIGLFAGIILFALYASNEAKEIFMRGLFIVFTLGLIFVIWKAIRVLID